jgi:hypothetical protein
MPMPLSLSIPLAFALFILNHLPASLTDPDSKFNALLRTIDDILTHVKPFDALVFAIPACVLTVALSGVIIMLFEVIESCCRFAGRVVSGTSRRGKSRGRVNEQKGGQQEKQVPNKEEEEMYGGLDEKRIGKGGQVEEEAMRSCEKL